MVQIPPHVSRQATRPAIKRNQDSSNWPPWPSTDRQGWTAMTERAFFCILLGGWLQTRGHMLSHVLRWWWWLSSSTCLGDSVAACQVERPRQPVPSVRSTHHVHGMIDVRPGCGRYCAFVEAARPPHPLAMARRCWASRDEVEQSGRLCSLPDLASGGGLGLSLNACRFLWVS